MSCEKKRHDLRKLEKKLPDISTDNFYAVQAREGLASHCPKIHRSHTRKLLEALNLGVSHEESESIRAETFDMYTAIADELLTRHEEIQEQ